MERNLVYFLVIEGMADWEPVLAAVGIREYGRHEPVMVGFSRDPVKTIGGFRILPDIGLDEAEADRAALVVVPGGKMWEAGTGEEVERFLAEARDHGAFTAFICAASLIPVRLGWTAGTRHTSNTVGYVKSMVPEYGDEEWYVDELAVTGDSLITASGLGYVEFAREIFRALDLRTEEEREGWYRAFKHGILPPGMA